MGDLGPQEPNGGQPPQVITSGQQLRPNMVQQQQHFSGFQQSGTPGMVGGAHSVAGGYVGGAYQRLGGLTEPPGASMGFYQQQPSVMQHGQQMYRPVLQQQHLYQSQGHMQQQPGVLQQGQQHQFGVQHQYGVQHGQQQQQYGMQRGQQQQHGMQRGQQQQHGMQHGQQQQHGMQHGQQQQHGMQQPMMSSVLQQAHLPTLIQQQNEQVQRYIANGQPIPQQQLQNLQMLMLMQSRNQQSMMQQQQQGQPMSGLMQQQMGSGAGTSLAAAVAASMHPGRSDAPPPAKRQAIDMRLLDREAQLLATKHFRMFAAKGVTSSMNQEQQHQLFQKLYMKARESLLGSASQPGKGAMRVSVDKRDRTLLDNVVNAEDTTAKDHASEVLRRCEEISSSLRKHLSKGSKKRRGDGLGDTKAEAAEEYQQVTQVQLIEACGDNARYFKPYQIVGVNFLMLLYRTQVGGAILADEMGLGKTAQLITYLGAIAKLENDPGPHLVVVPASLLENWQRELRRWCPSLKSIVYYGKHRSIIRRRLRDLRKRMEDGEEVSDDLTDLQDPDLLEEIAASEKLAKAASKDDEDFDDDDDSFHTEDAQETDDEEYDAKYDPDEEVPSKRPIPDAPAPKWDYSAPLQSAPFNVMLTSYTLFERDSSEQRADREFLESWKWSHLIMDEAHALKNRAAQRTTRLRRVANVSRRRIMMTGTPLQNDLNELQNLMHFLLPQVFAAESFEDFAEMIKGDEAEVKKLTDRMKQLLGPFVLRRLKTEVAGQLTEKKRVTEFIDMTPEQREMYDASLKSMRSQITEKVSDTIVSDSSQAGMEKFMRSIGAKKINHMFTHLRKIAQHPLLIRHYYNDDTVKEIAQKAFGHNLFSGNATLKRVTEELMGYSDFGLHAFCYGAGPDFAMHRLSSLHLMTSTKFQFLAKVLPELKENGSKPLIFSQWTAVLDILEWLMEELQLPYVRLDGSTAVDERLATVDRFNTSEDVFAFLLSTRAGGQGLNLTGADTVILHDVDFNPQIDKQAEDRCHRLGQTKPVMVYRLVAKASVDQNIYNLSQSKLKLDAAVLDGITTGKGAKQRENAAERQQMGLILRSLFAGEEDYGDLEEEVHAEKHLDTIHNNRQVVFRPATDNKSANEDSCMPENLHENKAAAQDSLNLTQDSLELAKEKRETVEEGKTEGDPETRRPQIMEEETLHTEMATEVQEAATKEEIPEVKVEEVPDILRKREEVETGIQKEDMHRGQIEGVPEANKEGEPFVKEVEEIPQVDAKEEPQTEKTEYEQISMSAPTLDIQANTDI